MRTEDRSRKSRRVATGGLFAALSLVFLFSAALLPIATYLAPILAGLALLPVALELGAATALIAFCAVALLAVFLVPDVEAVAMFLGFFGWYPLLRGRLQRFRIAPMRWIAKFLLFNLAICAAYGVLIFVFSMQAIAQELRGIYGIALLLLGNVLFFFYDRMLERVLPAYTARLRPRLFGQNAR